MSVLLRERITEATYKPEGKDLGPLNEELFKRKTGYRQIPLKVETPIFKLPVVWREAVHIHRLRMLDSDKYALRRVLFVQIEKTEDGEAFIAKIPSLEVFGVGGTQKEAIKDFQSSLMEDYELLKEERDKLGNYLQGYFASLTNILRELPCR